MAEEEEKRSAESPSVGRFPCPMCAAELRFDAQAGQLKCAHCGHLAPVPSGPGPSDTPPPRDFAAGLASAPRGLGTRTRVQRCEGCGAAVASAARVTAHRCAYCGSTQVLDQDESPDALRPEALVPFSRAEPEAHRALKQWLAAQWFRPSALAHLARVEPLRGLYVPFWSYAGEVHSTWRAERGQHYFTDEEYTIQEQGRFEQRSRRVRHTRWEGAWGHRFDHYDALRVCASRGLPEHLAARLAAGARGELVPYAPGYLAGFGAEEYSLGLEEGWARARARVEAEQRARCESDVGGDVHRHLKLLHRYSNLTFRYLLLPIWVGSYRFRGRSYTVLVDGHSCEVHGDAPLSLLKVAALVLALAAVLAALVVYFRG